MFLQVRCRAVGVSKSAFALNPDVMPTALFDVEVNRPLLMSSAEVARESAERGWTDVEDRMLQTLSTLELEDSFTQICGLP